MTNYETARLLAQLDELAPQINAQYDEVRRIGAGYTRNHTAEYKTADAILSELQFRYRDIHNVVYAKYLELYIAMGSAARMRSNAKLRYGYASPEYAATEAPMDAARGAFRAEVERLEACRAQDLTQAA